MANRSSTSPSASIVVSGLNDKRNTGEYDDLRNLGWELIAADDLYADVESLDSFSMSSQSIEEAVVDVSRGNQIDLGMNSDVFGFDVPMTNLDCGSRVAQSLPSDYGDHQDGFHHAEDSADVVDTLQMHTQDLVSFLGFHGSEPNVDFSPPKSGSDGIGDGSLHGESVKDDIGLLVDSIKCIGSVPIFAPVVNLDDARRVEKHDDDHLRGCNNYSSGSELKGGGSGINDEENEDDNDDRCTVGLDDELVPWALTHRLDNQRMKKLGKRTKTKNSKKMAHIYTKSACARGKHGLGLMVY